MHHKVKKIYKSLLSYLTIRYIKKLSSLNPQTSKINILLICPYPSKQTS